jgi:hypothetical protein
MTVWTGPYIIQQGIMLILWIGVILAIRNCVRELKRENERPCRRK